MASDTWTIKRALEWTEGYFVRKGDSNPRLSAQWLIGDACNLSRLELYVNFERPLSAEELNVLHDYVLRRGQGEPLQYITGEVAFRHINVKVRPNVLIPRPETEVLVSEALALLPRPARPQDVFGEATPVAGTDPNALDADSNALDTDPNASVVPAHSRAIPAAVPSTFSPASSSSPAPSGSSAPFHSSASSSSSAPSHSSRPSHLPASSVTDKHSADLLVADLCTGTGCVAASIAFEHPQTRVVATDISPEAVRLAQENIENLGLSERVEVIRCDVADGIDASFLGTFDLVVANPPYIPSDLLERLPREVSSFEPASALDGGADGLKLFRQILMWCKKALRPEGGFALELHEQCLDKAAEFARTEGFEAVRVTHDLAGRPRVLTGILPASGAAPGEVREAGHKIRDKDQWRAPK